MPKAFLCIIGCLALGYCAHPDSPGGASSSVSQGRQLVRIEYPEDSISTMVFFYNDVGDIERIYNSTDTAFYRYAGDSIFLYWLDGQGQTVATQHYQTALDGKILSNDVLDPAGVLFARTTYEYNPQGRILKLVRKNMRTNDTFTLDYTYVDENVQNVRISRNDQFIDSYTYEYDTTKPNNFLIDIDNLTNEFFAKGRIGKMNRHLMTKSIRMNPEGDTTSLRYYSYDLDAEGYVLTRTDTDGQYNYSIQRRYIYR